MSHVVTIRTRVHDPAALAAACRRLGLAEPEHGTARLYSGPVGGLIVHLPGWTYPVAFDTLLGHAHFDNFEGRWGEQRQLDRLLQAYAVEACRAEARRKGYVVSEQPLADGSIRLQLAEGG